MPLRSLARLEEPDWHGNALSVRERRAFVWCWMPCAVACCTLHVARGRCMLHATCRGCCTPCVERCMMAVAQRLGLLHCIAETSAGGMTGGVPILRDAVLARHIADLQRRPGLAPIAPQSKWRRRRQHPQQMLTSAAAAAAECTQARAHGCAALRCCGGDEHLCVDRSERPTNRCRSRSTMGYSRVPTGTVQYCSAAAPAAASCAPRPTTPSGGQTCTYATLTPTSLPTTHPPPPPPITHTHHPPRPRVCTQLDGEA